MSAEQHLTVVLPTELAERVQQHVGADGVAAYVTAAVERQLERDDVAELLEAIEGAHGAVTDEQIEAARALMLEADGQRGPTRGVTDPEATMS